MRNAAPPNTKVFIKSFPGATTECMEHYCKPSLKYEPDLIIIHAGTNDLRSTKSAETIADEMISLCTKLKTDSNDVIVSGIVCRKDRLSSKGLGVNNLLKNKCTHHHLGYIDNGNIGIHHLNGSGLHLNSQGTVSLANNFLRAIKL